MNKFLTALALFTMVMTPVAAQAHPHDNDNVERPRRGGGGAGNLIGGLIVGAIVGSAIASSRQQPQNTWDSQYPQGGEFRQRRRVCFQEQIVEFYYGRKFIRYEYRCR